MKSFNIVSNVPIYIALVFALAYGVAITFEYSIYRETVAVLVDELEGEVDMLQDTVIDLTD